MKIQKVKKLFFCKNASAQFFCPILYVLQLQRQQYLVYFSSLIYLDVCIITCYEVFLINILYILSLCYQMHPLLISALPVSYFKFWSGQEHDQISRRSFILVLIGIHIQIYHKIRKRTYLKSTDSFALSNTCIIITYILHRLLFILLNLVKLIFTKILTNCALKIRLIHSR